MSEEWLPVVDYEGWYEVSSMGDVRRIARGHGATVWRTLEPRQNRSGYWVVCLTRRSASTRQAVHRLVAAAFIGPCPPGKKVNHKDGNRLNPAADNLEYVTRGENVRHGRRNGWNPQRGEAKASAKLTEADVRAIRASALGQRALGRLYGVCHSTIADIQHGEKWAHVASVPDIERVLT